MLCFFLLHIHGGYSVVNMQYSYAKYKLFLNYIYTSARRSGDSNDSKRVCAYAQSRSSLQIVSRQVLNSLYLHGQKFFIEYHITTSTIFHLTIYL